MKKWFYSTIPLLAIVLTLIGCSSSEKDSKARLPYYHEATFTPIWLSSDLDRKDTLHKISNFKLLNQEGDTLTNEATHNKIYVADFFFSTCLGICPKMTDQMFTIQEAFADNPDVLLLSHTVNPSRDSVPVLANYASMHGALAGKWHFLTGDKTQLYQLGRQEYFIEEDLGLEKSPDDFLHTENFVLVDREGHIRGIYNGINKASVQQLIADIHLLLEEE